MKRHFRLSAFLLTLAIAIAAVGYTQTRQQRTAASLAGVWKGNFPNAPAVEFHLQAPSGKPAGTVIFYKVVNNGDSAEIRGKVEAPLLDPVFDGQTLSFKVKREDDSFFQGRVSFVADHEAILRSHDQATSENQAMTLRRAQ